MAKESGTRTTVVDESVRRGERESKSKKRKRAELKKKKKKDEEPKIKSPDITESAKRSIRESTASIEKKASAKRKEEEDVSSIEKKKKRNKKNKKKKSELTTLKKKKHEKLKVESPAITELAKPSIEESTASIEKKASSKRKEEEDVSSIEKKKNKNKKKKSELTTLKKKKHEELKVKSPAITEPAKPSVEESTSDDDSSSSDDDPPCTIYIRPPAITWPSIEESSSEDDPFYSIYDEFLNGTDFRQVLKYMTIITDSEDSDIDEVLPADYHERVKYLKKKPASKVHCSSTRSVVVKGFNTSLGEDNLRGALENHFGQCGNILCLTIPKDNESGVLEGCAFIDLFSPKAARNALSLNHCELNGFPLTVHRPIPSELTSDGASNKPHLGASGIGTEKAVASRKRKMQHK